MPKSTPPRSFFLSLRFYKREEEAERFFFFGSLLLFFVKPHTTLRTYVLRGPERSSESDEETSGMLSYLGKGFASLLCCATRSKSRT